MTSPEERAQFQLAKRVCCELHKQDIPEVQAVIRLLQRPMASAFRRLGDEIVDEIDARVAELTADLTGASVAGDAENPEDVVAAILASLYLVVEGRAGAPFPPRVQRLIEQGVDSLLGDGAASVGRVFEGPRRALVRRAAIAELEAMIRFSVTSRRAEIEEAIEEMLTSRQARRELSVLAQAGLGRRPTGSAPRSRQEALEDVRRAATGEPGTGRPPIGQGTRVGATLDSWAYRWFVTGQFEALSASGVELVRVVNNPPFGPDERTTAFCRWVHGRIKSVRQLRARVQRQVEAALAGDVSALQANAPFIDPEIARRGTEDEFAAFFRTAGLPPFHFGCRDDIEAVRPR